ncbi:MAG: hypothetical protein Q9181_005735 [Wetmoreana brouardii]
MASIADWFAKIPRNTQESVQRLTLYGWLRLILIVAAYLLIRPYLMKLAGRSQMAAHEQAVNTHRTTTPNTLRGHVEEPDEPEVEEAMASSSSYESKIRRRQRQAIDGAVAKEIAQAEDDDEDEDVAFLKKYCT